MKGRALILVGAGKAETLSAEGLRRAAAHAAREAATLRAATLEIQEPDPEVVAEGKRSLEEPPWEDIGLALGEGAALALYKFDRYITTGPKKTMRAVSIVSQDRKRLEGLRRGVALARVLCEATELARDLANAPEILFADEPTGNLDSGSSEEIMALFTELNRKGRTVVLVTHDPEVARYARRILTMQDGLLVSDQPNAPEATP